MALGPLCGGLGGVGESERKCRKVGRFFFGGKFWVGVRFWKGGGGVFVSDCGPLRENANNPEQEAAYSGLFVRDGEESEP